MTVALIGYYTITPTHCGTGQAADAVDLPIAREAHTGHPILPATSIKGSLRENFERTLGKTSPEVISWFGPQIDAREGEGGAGLKAGSITVGEGRLLAFPARALNTAFCYVTCPLILERFERDLRAYGLQDFWSEVPRGGFEKDSWQGASAMISESCPDTPALVIDDLVFDATGNEVRRSELIVALAEALGQLLPDNERSTKNRLASNLIVLRDDYFNDLVRRTTPVQARVRLNDQKTTTGGGGNLWYEETLPSDSIFASFLAVRRQTRHGGRANGDPTPTPESPESFFERLKEQTHRPLQIGGNETVGQGLCLWNIGAKADG